MQKYQNRLQEPTPQQKGPYAGLLKVRASSSADNFMDFMNNS